MFQAFFLWFLWEKFQSERKSRWAQENTYRRETVCLWYLWIPSHEEGRTSSPYPLHSYTRETVSVLILSQELPAERSFKAGVHLGFNLANHFPLFNWTDYSQNFPLTTLGHLISARNSILVHKISHKYY